MSSPDCQQAAIGAVECTNNGDCERNLELWLQIKEGPHIRPDDIPAQTIASSRCVGATVDVGDDLVAGAACRCELSIGGGSLRVGPQGAGCYDIGRSGVCLWDDSEYESCAGEPASRCEADCERLLELRKIDDETRFETELFRVECLANRCISIAQVDDQCFVNQQHAGPAPCDAEALWSPPEAPEDDADDTGPAPAAGCP